MKRPFRCGFLVLLVATLVTACTQPEVPLEDPVVSEVSDLSGGSLGSIAIPVSCTAEAGSHLRRGAALIHNMTYTEAEQEFRTASEQDEGCALAY